MASEQAKSYGAGGAGVVRFIILSPQVSSKSKSSCASGWLHKACLAVLGMAMTGVVAHAQSTVNIGNMNPTDSSYGYQYKVPADGNPLTITGSLNGTINPGGFVSSSSPGSGQLESQGKFSWVSAPPGNVEDFYQITGLPPQNETLTVFDPKTGSSITIPTYSSNELENGGYFKNFSTKAMPVFDPTGSVVNGAYYIKTGIAEITSAGGLVNIDLGDSSKNVRDVDNTIALAAKQSTLFSADGTAGNDSRIVWQSDNYVDFKVAPVISHENQGGSAQLMQFQNVTVDEYSWVNPGDHSQGVQKTSRTFNIESKADLAAYNDWLKGQFQYWVVSGTEGGLGLSENQVTARYLNELAATRGPEQAVSWAYKVWEDGNYHDNKATENVGSVHVVYVNGEHASVQIDSGARLASSGTSGGVLRGDNGAAVVNDGHLDHWRPGATTNASVGIEVVNANGTNNGVLNSGLFVDKDGRQNNVTNWGSFGMYGLGNSKLVNNGVINQALTTNDFSSPKGVSDGIDKDPPEEDGWVLARGMWVDGSSIAINNGSINLVDGRDGSGKSFGAGTGYGVIVTGNGSFTNSTTGSIYVGREAQESVNDNTADVGLSGGVNLSAGVYVQTSGAVKNEGNITLGSGVRNAAGILVLDSTGRVENSGTINVNGSQPGRTNYGMTVRNSGTSAAPIVNSGDIHVSGMNNVGLHVLSSSEDAEVTTTSSGSITVEDGQDPDTGYRNYAVMVEGSTDPAYRATANLQSTVTLKGQGSIGIYVQNNGTVNVAAMSSPDIQNTDQIGFLLSGNGAKANIETITTSDHGFDRVTLFRVADGAQFDGSNGIQGLPMELSTTGKNSAGVVGTGAGAKVDTGKATFNVGGENTIGVRIEGGATGNISHDSIINLTGSGATAGVVDGQKYNVIGQAIGSPVATKLNSSADIASLADKVVAYIAKNYGDLTLNDDATVDLSGHDSVGVRIEQNGRMTNHSSSALHVAHGVGVQANGGNATIARLGQVVVDDGVAGAQLLNGAGLVANGSTGDKVTSSGTADGVLLDTGAAGLTASNFVVNTLGSGTGIQNKAETSAITLTDVTVNAQNGAGIRTGVAINSSSSGNVINVAGAGTGYVFDNYSASMPRLTSGFLFGNGFTVNVGNTAGNATGNGVYANTIGAVQADGTIRVLDTTGGSALIARDAQSVLNTGDISSNSSGHEVLDASGSNDKIIQNDGILHAADAQRKVIQSGAGNDVINLTAAGASTIGNIHTGAGKDAFQWTAGSFNGSVDYGGTGGNNFALVQNGDLGSVSHIQTPGGNGNMLQLSRVSGANARIGTLASDDLERGTNMGSGWNVLNVVDSSDVRIVGDLQMSGTEPVVQISGGSVARVGGYGVTNGSLGVSNVYLGDVATPAIGTGTLFFDNAGTTQAYSGVIFGDGDVVRDANGATLLTNHNHYTGSTTVRSGGTLSTGIANALSAYSDHTVALGGTLDTRGYNQAVANLDNAGLVTLASNTPGSYLMTHNYASNGGTMRLSLDAVRQVADRLVVDGGTVTGHTLLDVVPIGNGGTETTGDGIMVVEALNGANTTAQSTKDGFNLQQEYVLAGAYEYRLFAGNQYGQGENWYLRSRFRPEIGMYYALPNVLRGDTLAMLGTLHQRMGDEIHPERAGTTSANQERRIWSRVIWRDGDIDQKGDLETRASVSSKGFQAGIDLKTTQTWNLGVYAGYLNDKAGVNTPSASGRVNTGDIKADSFYLGGYGTYTAENGFYADAVLQFGRHDIKLDPERGYEDRKADLDANSVTASLEVGRPFMLGGNGNTFIEPQAQLVYMYTDIDDSHVGGVTKVSLDAKNAFTGRIGARFGTSMDTSWGKFVPYARGNIWHSFSGSDSLVFSDTLRNEFKSGSGYTSPEVALGFTFDMTPSLRLYGELGHQFKAGSSDTSIHSMNAVSVGMKFTF